MFGSDIISIAQSRIGDRYVLGAMVDYKNSKWTGPWDCAEFATWCVYQTYGFLFGCDSRGSPGSAYTGEWQRQARTKGRVISVSEARRTPGAFVLRFPATGSSGIGHIVISVGDGTTLEAADAQRGVIHGTLAGRRWDIGVLLPDVDYSLESDDWADFGVLRVQEFPQYSSRVVEVQEALLERGFNPGPIDGLFGEATEAAVVSFQTKNGLLIDGEVGPQTLKALGLGDEKPPNNGTGASSLAVSALNTTLIAPKSPLASIKFADLADEYIALFKTVIVDVNKKSSVDKAVSRVLVNKSRYETVGSKLGGVPWYFIGAINELESTTDFSTHLHNGDPLTARTVNIPAGRPKAGKPPFSWEESAVDALIMKEFHKEDDWSLPRILYRLERYNGFGTRRHGVFTPYLWSGCNHYIKGKYVKDKKWDPNAVSKQIGAGVILFELARTGDIEIEMEP